MYEWGIGKKFIEARTYVNAPEGEYERYLTMFGVQNGKLHAWQFTFDGHAEGLDFSIDGKKLSSARTMKSANGGGDSVLHQSIELVEANKFHWIVQIEKDGKLQPIMDGFWIREAAAAAR